MKKIILTIAMLMTSLSVWADIIRPPHRGVYQHDQGAVIPLVSLLILFAANLGAILYLKRRNK